MDNVLSLLGLVYRAKKLILGEEVLNEIKDVKYLFIANDASSKTKERYIKKCHYYNISYNTDFSSEELSRAIGKTNSKVIGITDAGFTNTIINKLK